MHDETRDPLDQIRSPRSLALEAFIIFLQFAKYLQRTVRTEVLLAGVGSLWLGGEPGATSTH